MLFQPANVFSSNSKFVSFSSLTWLTHSTLALGKQSRKKKLSITVRVVCKMFSIYKMTANDISDDYFSHKLKNVWGRERFKFIYDAISSRNHVFEYYRCGLLFIRFQEQCQKSQTHYLHSLEIGANTNHKSFRSEVIIDFRCKRVLIKIGMNSHILKFYFLNLLKCLRF